MGVKEKATVLHEAGFNCTQSVLAALGSYTGLDEKTALSISGGFGGGMRCGEICGAISGAIMAISLAFPYMEASDLDAKKRVNQLSAEFIKRFREHYGCVRCMELKKDRKSCDELIDYCAELGEEIIKNNL